MIARKLRSMVAVSLCGLACALVGGVTPAVAGTSRFGGLGTGAGQLAYGLGLAIDQESGDIYVPDFYNERVSKFDGSGGFLFAWGWGVNFTSPAEELQTCTLATECQKGTPGPGAGQFASSCGAQAVAVDNDPLSSSYKDVYVVDFCNHRVQKFDSSGKFLLMFGGHVNTTTGGNVCVAGEACTKGTEGGGNGEFEWAYARSNIAVGPDGAVYVGDKARVEIFEPSGSWRENISLAGLSSTGRATALAVDSTGDVYVADEEASGVHEFEPDGVEKATQFDALSTSVQAITLDTASVPSHLFVADSQGGVHLLEYDSDGNELSSFGFDAVDSAQGIAFSDSLGELYVSNGNEVVPLTVPPPGPTIESESAVAGERGAATLAGSVDRQGSETSVHFEYVAEASYQASGFADASSTPSVSIGSGFDIQDESAALSKLTPGSTYHYRIVASNASGNAVGSDQQFTEVPPVLVEGPWATDVASTSATLAAQIDPLGASTGYRLEYGTSTSYGHTLTGNVGEGTSYSLISYHEQGLQPGATYHYRLVTTNEVGTVEGADHTFTTQAAVGQELVLPDGREWELVSPPDKGGALIEDYYQTTVMAADDGSAISYPASEPLGEGAPMGKAFISQILSKRGADGWDTQTVDLPHRLGAEEEVQDIGFEYEQFSSDLSLAAIRQKGTALVQLSPEAAPGNRLYLRKDSDESFSALLTPANVLQSAKLDGVAGENEASREEGQEFLAGTPDLGHAIIKSDLALTAESVEGHGNLYEWGFGELRPVNVAPNGHPDLNATLAGEDGAEFGLAPRAISSDGRWVAWIGPYPSRLLYVRDMVEGKTVQVGGRHAEFQTMSADGSRIFFIEDGELYEFDTSTQEQIALTSDHGAGESSAGVQETLLGVSEDGSYIYFVANGVLAPGAVPGHCADKRLIGEESLPGATCNLYLLHYDGTRWEAPRYIATLSVEDEHDWYSPAFGGGLELEGVRSRVSPDGRYLTFMSNRSLTGYDNVDANSGKPDEEVYLYDGLTDHLVCASCDPTGARPVGIFDNNENLMERKMNNTSTWEGHWLAGMIPGWDSATNGGRSVYQPRYLSNSGRLFFDSTEALVPQDTNGLMDVYEYEPAGVGGCTSGGVGFSESFGGCVNLISAGTSSSESIFLDASEDGNDVFLLTSGRLTAADYDTSLDVYDAHICSSAVPCATVTVSSPPCTSGDSCKAAPSPQPEIFGAAPSATFSGVGNVVEEAKNTVVKRKAKPKRHAKQKKRKQKKRKGRKAGKSGAGRASRKGKG